MDSPESTRSTPLTPNRLADGVFLVSCWLLAATGSAYLIVPSGVLPLVRSDLGIGAISAGWLVSAPFAAEAVGAIPIGLVLDRTKIRRLLTVAVVCFVGINVASARLGAAGLYVPLLVTRVLGGLAFVTIWLGTIRLVTNRFPDRTATALGILTTSGPAGVAIGLVLGPAVASGRPWFDVFWVVAALLVVTLAVFLVGTDRAESAAAEQPGRPLAVLSLALRSRGLLLVAVLSFVAYSLFLLFSSWLPSVFSDVYSLPLGLSSLLVAVFPAVGVLARSAGGIVSDYLLGGDARTVLRGSFVALVPAIIGITVESSIAVVVASLLLAGFFVQSGIGLFFSYGPQFVSASARGTAVAVLSTAGLTGSFTAPVVAGAIVSASGEFTAVFGYAIALSLVGLAASVFLPRAPQTDDL